MTEISGPFTQGVEMIVDYKVGKLKYDRTVKGVIYSVENVNTGEYKVRYSGNIFFAYAADLDKKYSVNEEVYVKVPEGDFSNKKIITGRVTEISLSQGQINSLSNHVVDISPTFDKIYTYNADRPWKVTAGKRPEDTDGTDYIEDPPPPNALNKGYDKTDGRHLLFQQYARQYEYICIKASFKTQFHTKPIKGNYGIELSFFANKGDGTVETIEYRLDVNSFVGDPYNFTVFSPQQLIIKVQKNYLLGLNYIKLFQENFDLDQRISYVTNNGNITEVKTVIDTPNIFVDDVYVNYVDVIDLTKEPYYCYIAARQGSVFSSSGSSTLELKAILLSYGEVIDSKKCTYKWFERDLSIMIGNDPTDPNKAYDKDAGFGWKTMDKKTSDTITIAKADVIHQQRYKCVVTYNNDVVMTAEKEVLNTENGYAYHIEQKTNGTSIELQLVNDATNEDLVGDWYISYPDGAYAAFTGGTDQNSISVADYLKYTYVTFYCAVKEYGTHSPKKVVGTIEYTIFNSESEEDLAVSYTGEELYRYDANGDIAVEEFEKEHTLQANLKWKEGFGASYRIEWLGPDGQNIPNDKTIDYSPTDSMMQEIWVDNNNVLHYNIKSKYKITANNNTFTIKITTIDGQVYTFEKEILFVKDGDPGTNGTTYVALIRPCNSSYNKLNAYTPLEYYSDQKSWGSSINLLCYVYKDGIQINKPNSLSSGYDVKYEWNSININHQVDPINQQLVTISGADATDITSGNYVERYIKVTVTINDHVNDSNTTVAVYSSYPIDVLVRNYNKDMFPYGVNANGESYGIDINDIPMYIKYSASGEYPSFLNTSLKFTYTDSSLKFDDCSDQITSSTPGILDIDSRTEENGIIRRYLKPASNFIADDTKYVGLLKCNNSMRNSYVLRTIIMYLDTYGNEAINGWDGIRLAIDEANGKYIFAPQIGAGGKNTANQFTGVVMGKDSAQKKIGLYGYRDGESTFGFKSDGTGYIGPIGKGQILFDGTEGTIKSGNYVPNTSGMKIELTYGHIDAYNFFISSGNMTLDSEKQHFLFKLGTNNQSYFRVCSVNDDQKNILFNVQPNSYYLKSANFKIDSNTGEITGTKINLETGDLQAGGDTQIQGTIKANKGNIGGWKITSNGLYYYPSATSSTDNDYETNATFKLSTQGNGSLYIGNTSEGSVGNSPYLRYSNGNLQVSGIIRAKSLYLSDGTKNVIKQNDKGNNSIDGNYIDCKGIKVTKNGNITFEVTDDGEVSISGNISMGAGSTIDWNSGLASNAPFLTDKDLADYGYGKMTTISGTSIFTPEIDTTKVKIFNIGDASQGGTISISGAQTAEYALDIRGDAVRISSAVGDIFLENAGIGGKTGTIQLTGDHVQINNLYLEGVPVREFIKKVMAAP